MVSKPGSETTKKTRIKSIPVQCSAPGRRIKNDGWSELDYLDYALRKRSKA